MNLTINIDKNALKESLSFLKEGIDNKGIVEEFSLIEMNPINSKSIVLRTFSGFVGLESKLTIVSSGKLQKIYFSFESLYKICFAPSKKNNLIFEISDKEILIISGSAKYNFLKISQKEVEAMFLIFNKFKTDKSIKIKNKEIFNTTLDFVSVMQSDNVSRPELCGIGDNLLKSEKYLMSTNLISIAIAKIKDNYSKLWLPSYAVKVIKASSELVVQIDFGNIKSPIKYKVHFGNGNKLYIRGEKVNQPQISEWIKGKYYNTFEISVNLLSEVIERAEAVFASTTSSEIAYLLLFEILKENKLIISAVNRNNTFKESIKINDIKNIKNLPKKINLSLEELKKAVKGLSNTDSKKINISTSENTSILKLSIKDYEYYLYGQAI